MKIPKTAQREAKRLYRACLAEGRLDEGRVRTVVRDLVERKPRHYLPILLRLHRLVRLEQQRRQATVRSALPLAPALQDSVRGSLTRLYGPDLDFAFTHDPASIGGMRVQVGSDVYDGTVRARLNQLEEAF